MTLTSAVLSSLVAACTREIPTLSHLQTDQSQTKLIHNTAKSPSHAVNRFERIANERSQLTSPGLYSTYSSLNASSPVMHSNHLASNKPWQIPNACTLKFQQQTLRVPHRGTSFLKPENLSQDSCNSEPSIFTTYRKVASSRDSRFPSRRLATDLSAALSLVMSQSMISFPTRQL